MLYLHSNIITDYSHIKLLNSSLLSKTGTTHKTVMDHKTDLKCITWNWSSTNVTAVISSFMPDMAKYDSAKNTVYMRSYYYIHYKLIIKVICFNTKWCTKGLWSPPNLHSPSDTEHNI